jgi:glucose-1-phosphate cytidylyltransferase
MKVVLFCGGQGLRLREVSESIPKPMVSVGYRPILWHVMRYYAHFGHKEFVLCLGYRADVIKDYFLHYTETISNDFVLTGGGRSVELLQSDIDEWRISFIDTGQDAPVGQRLRQVASSIGDDDVFLCNYGDVLTDAPLDQLLDRFLKSGKMAAFLAVKPLPYTFHVVHMDRRSQVTAMQEIAATDLRINGGYFMFRRPVLDEIRPGEDLVPDVLPRLIERGEVMAFRYDGFWAPMDTLRDWQKLDGLVGRGDLPWALWRHKDEEAARPAAHVHVDIAPPTPTDIVLTGDTGIVAS